MKLEFHMVTAFGGFLADGHLGNQFRNLRIESVWDRVESVTFDFTGVTNLTDSFVHATFGNMAEEHGDESEIQGLLAIGAFLSVDCGRRGTEKAPSHAPRVLSAFRIPAQAAHPRTRRAT